MNVKAINLKQVRKLEFRIERKLPSCPSAARTSDSLLWRVRTCGGIETSDYCRNRFPNPHEDHCSHSFTVRITLRNRKIGPRNGKSRDEQKKASIIAAKISAAGDIRVSIVFPLIPSPRFSD